MPSIAEKVAASIRESILTGELRLGEHLREIDLCKRLNVSRTPVREAFRILQSEGFLTHTANSGVIVTPILLREAVQLIEIRFSLETLAAKHAVKNINADQISQLKQINDELLNVGAENEEEIGLLDVRFHNLIAKTAKNNVLYEMLISTYNKNSIIFSILPVRKERSVKMHKEHSDIIFGLESGDGELASKYIEIHLYNAMNSFMKKVEAYAKAHSADPNAFNMDIPLFISSSENLRKLSSAGQLTIL